jgi:hypothetical protein
MLDSSIVNVAVEPIARQLHAGLAVVQWTVSGYLLALGAGLAGTAYLARRFGTQAVYRASIVAFTAASVLCALAPAAGVLVGARVLQGLAAAPLVPLAMSMLLGGGQDPGDQSPGDQDSGPGAGRGRGAKGISPLAGIVLFLGPALGPTVGGALIGAVGWRGIFLINVPLGALAAVAVGSVPAALAPGRQPGARFDLPGLILLAAGLTGLLLGASQGASAGWSDPACWLPLAAGAALMAGYAAWAAHREQPALDLTLARRRGPVLSMALCALAAGLALAPQGLITGLSTALAPRWLARFTVRATVLAGFAVLAVVSLGLLLITAATPLWLIAVILAVRSVSIGLVINPLLQALLQPLRPDQLGDASTLFNTWQRIAGSFGIGLVAALYTTQARTGGPAAALHAAGLVMVVIAAAGALGSLALPAVRNSPQPGR